MAIFQRHVEGHEYEHMLQKKKKEKKVPPNLTYSLATH